MWKSWNVLKKIVGENRIPGQLVIQFTNKCNARCPQCGMRVTEKFNRSELGVDRVKKMIDIAAQNGIQAISFTGGEPMLFFEELVDLIQYAGNQGIHYIRTGTNGFMFANPDGKDFEAKTTRIVERLADTKLRNFWISMDSANILQHEKMRGFPGVVKGVEKAIPIFHAHGLYPSANLGINRCTGHQKILFTDSRQFLDNFKNAFRSFYRFVIDMGFTIVNSCYPMSIDEDDGLNPAYAATSTDDIVRFTPTEKALLFKALSEVIPEYRSQVRIFSPLSSLVALYRQYTGDPVKPYGCRGGIDFFYIDAADGMTYPCGYRGDEPLGESDNLKPLATDRTCLQCDWECFRDPSEMFGPVLQFFRQPHLLIRRWMKDREYFRLWRSDLMYYRACDLFNGRKAPDYGRMKTFQSGVDGGGKYLMKSATA